MNAITNFVTTIIPANANPTVIEENQNLIRLVVDCQGEKYKVTMYAGTPNFIDVGIDIPVTLLESADELRLYRRLDVIQQEATLVKASLLEKRKSRVVRFSAELMLGGDVDANCAIVAEAFRGLRIAQAGLRAA